MDPISIFLAIVSIVTAGLSLFIIRGEEQDSNKIFSLFILAISLWTFGLVMFRITDSVQNALDYSRFYYVAAAAIPTFFLHFSNIFPTKKKLSFLTFMQYVPLASIIIGILLFPHLILSSVSIAPSGVKIASVDPFGYTAYTLYFLLFLVAAYLNLFRSYFKAEDKAVRAQLKFIFIGTIIPYGIAMYFDLILPPYDYTHIWVGPLMAVAVVWAILYAVYRHHLLNVKVVTTEFFVASLWLFILANTLVADSTQAKIENSILLAATILVGILLISSVRKEVLQRERIEKLATDLEAANKRLTELDRQKSEFVSFASHQLRAPLTAMKGYSSLLLEGDMGELPKPARDGIERIFDSAKTLTSIVDDYLNVSRIELGTMKYTFETLDLKALVEDVIAELRPNIERKGLKFGFSAQDSGTDYRTTADRDKLKQVIANLIDNSVKYTPSGSVDVSLAYDRQRNKLVFKIQDTGIGIAPEVIPHLFQKFSRADNGNKVNIKGTGLGLYVAKEIVAAHHGEIRAESEGEGKGSSFIVELEPFGKA